MNLTISIELIVSLFCLIKMKSSDKINIEKVAEIQQLQKKRRDQTMKIDSYLTFERNLGIFVNFTTNMIFKLYKD